MDAANQILKDMKTKEGQQKMKQWVKEYIAKEEQRDLKMQQLLSNTDYLKWLESFTLEHQKFSDDDWLYCQEKLSKEDLEHVENLHLLYSGIDKYARKNYIYPTECEFGNFYSIKLDNAFFKIGILVGQGTIFFCDRVQTENEKEFIDFNDISNSKTPDSVIETRNSLTKLSNMVISLHQNGIPLQAIVNTLNNTVDKLKDKNEVKK